MNRFESECLDGTELAVTVAQALNCDVPARRELTPDNGVADRPDADAQRCGDGSLPEAGGDFFSCLHPLKINKLWENASPQVVACLAVHISWITRP